MCAEKCRILLMLLRLAREKRTKENVTPLEIASRVTAAVARSARGDRWAREAGASFEGRRSARTHSVNLEGFEFFFALSRVVFATVVD